ncbi:MAG TPA: TonB-dependent receptor, partial [Thermoanaerobaculia bacterium]|nr:TonB-dependent receptor [Thermoanaerobaculia bacterium]
EGEGGLGNDAFDSRELSARLQWAGAGSEASLLARWNDSDTGIPRSGFTPTPRRHIDWQELEWGVPWSHVGAAWQLDGTLSQLRYDAGFRDPDDPFGFTAEDTDSRVDRARAVATRRLGGGAAGLAGWWAGGAEWERQTVSDRSVFGPSLDGARQRTAAAFTQLHLEGGRWAADLGARHDDNDVFGGATSPRAGVVVAAGSRLCLRASYGQAFRAPALGELFFPFFGNRDLRPERGRSAEVGAQWSTGPWSLDVAAFDNRQRDLIDFDFTTSRDVNVGRARSHGVDGELRFQQQVWELRLGGMRLHAEDRSSGRPLRNRPRDTAHLVAVARPGRSTLALTGSWVGERVNAHPETFADTRNPGYFTLDVAGSWQLVRSVAPYARLLNALDREHEPVLGFPAPGRTLIAGVRLEW